MNKWLIRKTSGSRSRLKSNGDYSDDRNSKKAVDYNDLPQNESIRNKNYHHTHLDTTLVKRWLHSQVGLNFDDIYSEFLRRIQPKYLDEYRECIYWYVAKKENFEIKENGEVWIKCFGQDVKLTSSMRMSFYVDPTSNKLKKIE
jgi:hypothetical protein